jgi:hypothetical protein
MAGMCVDGGPRDDRPSETPKQYVRVSVGTDFVIMGTDRIEVSADGKTLTAYTNDGVEIKFAKPATSQAIGISADFKTVVLNGTAIERAADGHLVISTPRTVITKTRLANDAATKPRAVVEIGDEMEDGTIYAGTSPDTHKPMYARPTDESALFTFNEAEKHADDLNAHGHNDFRVPSKNELDTLYENRDRGRLKGTFNQTGSHPVGWYWSSTSNFFNCSAWAERFSDRYQKHYYSRFNDLSLRLVR